MLTMHFAPLLHGQNLQWLIAGAKTSLLLFAASWIVAFFLAVLLVALRASPLRPAQWLVMAFVGYHRNVPGLVQLFVWYFGIPQLLPDSWQMAVNEWGGEFFFAWIALFLNAAAYMSEDLRSGMRSLAREQLEAARALGLSYVKAMRRVVLPQAIRIAVPPLVNQSLSLFKATSLAMAIGVGEMTYMSRQIENATFQTLEAFLLASGFYLFVSYAIMLAGAAYDRRLARLARGAST
jgi:polar amino acid transport system permease protein